MADILRHLVWNLGRARRLVGLHQQHVKSKKKNDPSRESDDLLRAAIVFAHASLEEFLRSCSALLLPKGSAKVLDEIPLAGLNNSGKPEKFLLGRLAEYRGRTVDDVINESVQQYLQKTSYNSSSDVAAALERCGLDINRIKNFLSSIDEMIKRRHQIVHRVDRDFSNRKRKLVATRITAKQAMVWIYQVLKMLLNIFGDFYDKHGALRLSIKNNFAS